MNFKMEKIEGKYYSTGIPTLDNLLSKKGFHKGYWIGFAGKPATTKSLCVSKMVGEWLMEGGGRCVIFITSEHEPSYALSQIIELGYDEKILKKLMKNKQLIFINQFNELVNNKRVSPRIETLTETIKEKVNLMKRVEDYEIMVVIDSLSAYWSGKPAVAQAKYAQLTRDVKQDIAIALVTFQVSIGTGQSYGWGGEHGVDGLLKFRKFIENGEEKVAVQIAKMRVQDHDRFMRKIEIINNMPTISDKIYVEGRFQNYDDMMESLKFKHHRETQDRRNEIMEETLKHVKKQEVQRAKEMQNITEILEKLTSILERITKSN